MSKYNLNNNHPLIPNSNNYLCENKYVSIHSIDRDSLKYPNSANFEIELPQDYHNIQSVSLYSWSFPANYSVFKNTSNNLQLVFKFTDIYNPKENGLDDPLQNAIYAGLMNKKISKNFNILNDDNFIITIEEGFYNPRQMYIELTNKMNILITDYLIKFFKQNEEYNYALDLFQEYSDFQVFYNTVSQNLWFGNRSSGFELLNNADFYKISSFLEEASCSIGTNVLPSFSNWGLPSYLGFTRCPIKSVAALNSNQYRFFYLEMYEGLWISPSSLPGAKVHFLSAPLKINFLGPAYIYMELDCGSSLNCIDETEPFELNRFTSTTNQTNGIVNSAFAKIAIPTTPISQWFDQQALPYKWFDPPMERIRKLKIKMRYHDGTLVDFAGFDYSIMLQFTYFSPQIPKKLNINNKCGKMSQ